MPVNLESADDGRGAALRSLVARLGFATLRKEEGPRARLRGVSRMAIEQIAEQLVVVESLEEAPAGLS